MGDSRYLRALSTEERQALCHTLWEIQNHRCFICDQEIDFSVHQYNIDHIHPLATGGQDACENFALTHERCNKSKQDADLEVARRLQQLQQIMQEASRQGEVPSLKHVLRAMGGSKYSFQYTIENGNTLKYSFDAIGDPTIRRTTIFTDELSGERTAFLEVPIAFIFHDDLINPRGINSSISLLIKEFHKPNPQLHMSLARIDDHQIKIFDGQHKAVAQIMLGVRNIVVRLFLAPDVDRLISTNTIAGSKLKQIAFDKAVVRQLHHTLYAEQLRRYQVDHNLAEDDFSFSEQELVDFFRGERNNIRNYIINSQKNVITYSPDNQLRAYINFDGKDTNYPLSYSTFEKTLLSTFINSKTILSTPINDKMEEGENKRYLEKEQLVQLCSLIASTLLLDRFSMEIGTHKLESKIASGAGKQIPDKHLIACRMFREEIMYVWIHKIEYVIKSFYYQIGMAIDEKNLFQRKIPDQVWKNISNFLINLRELPLWRNRGMASTVFGGKHTYEYWEHIFQTGSTTDGMIVLAKPLDMNEMIKSNNND